uniref:NADH dehydrogenase subunit 4L n=1 Tax=Ornithodoros compactus TaxID=1580120 RepID=UPI000738EC9F|nr:NADH dehydrogenase subunit 4L [Ornithodoros compactus]AIZ58565.1 NADH dehydrogenase subunit 4L [Ornithodoros compactus]QLD97215.1 NADH dehydrogenase subunit 4L [Ornithodoros compactus]QLD97228.1 NADH dehydrogenase subunit 4L [Ornithodoros compactus]UYB78271.1 NADH dehydrogenase subunit 4L [Ornithodoros compactus]
MFLVSMFLFLSGSFSLLMNRKHILLIMLSLEFMYLGVMVNVFIICGISKFFLVLIIFMIVVVCEAGMGLSVLVLSVYFYGSDKIRMMNLLSC